MVTTRLVEARGEVVLYRRPVALTAERFAGKRLSASVGFSFAAEADALPLTVNEFMAACRSLPIVFSAADDNLPLAVVGLGGSNVFVNEAGAWDSRGYMPDYVRRYPFIFATDAQGDRLTLCIDEAFAGLGDGDGEPLFVAGQPSVFTSHVLEFSRGYQARHSQTIAFVAELRRLDLLVRQEATVQMPGGQSRNIGSFMAIDPERWNALDGEAIIGLRKAGWLEAVVCHFVSQDNWSQVAARLLPSAPPSPK